LSVKTALITGSAQGIGAAIAARFRTEGWHVIGVDRQGGDVQLDLSDLGAVRPFVDGLSDTPDVLVNCAGVCFTRPFFEIDIERFEKTFTVNVTAAFALMQAVAARLVASGKVGSVVNIASNSAFLPKLEQLDYGASKAAMVSMTRSAALSLGQYGIRVNAIAPGVIDTPLTQSIAEMRSEIRGVSPEETLRPVIAGLPLGRMGTAAEIANLAWFLASEEASFITGQTFLADGGQVMR
jgi:NAD(P)-dependent dehydrogenase (short-subunit alcohol dehydrogenase family)